MMRPAVFIRPTSRQYWTLYSIGIIVLVILAVASYGLRSMHQSHAAVNLKPMGAGLYTEGINASTIDHAFLNIDWAVLEPQKGTFDWTSIDNVINQNPNVKYRLRLKAGIGAPTWLNAISGPCVTASHATTATAGCIPQFWKDSFLAEYQTFINAAGQKYDSNPAILDMVNGACMTFTAEPFILGGTGPGSAADDLYKAGLTLALDKNCLDKSTAMINTAFPTTRISLATFNGWQEQTGSSWPDEYNELVALRNIYGSKLILQNNGLANQTCSGTASSSNLCYLKSIAAPKGFQQGCGSKVAVCSQSQVVDTAIYFGGCFVEHTSWSSLGAQEAAYDAKLKAVPGCSGTTPPPSTCSSPPSAPGAITASAPTATSATMSWSASTPGSNCTLSSYKLFRAIGTIPPPPTGTPLATIPATAKSYSDMTLTTSTTYSYALVATDTSGHTSTSQTLTITTPSIPPASNGDVNGDGRVNAVDLSSLLTHDCGGPAVPGCINYPAADFDHDGSVGSADLSILLAHWTW